MSGYGDLKLVPACVDQRLVDLAGHLKYFDCGFHGLVRLKQRDQLGVDVHATSGSVPQYPPPSAAL